MEIFLHFETYLFLGGVAFFWVFFLIAQLIHKTKGSAGDAAFIMLLIIGFAMNVAVVSNMLQPGAELTPKTDVTASR